MVSVSILVVGFRSEKIIGQCLSAVRAAAPATPHEIRLIDNGGGETETMVRRAFPHVKIVASEGNIGFGAANNRLAANATAPLLLLLNPDAVARPGAIDALVQFAAARPEASAWGGRMVSLNGIADPGNALILPRPADYLRATVQGLGAFSRAQTTGDDHVDVLSGGFMMIRADVFRAIGGFDESFFLYSEEIDFFRRFRAAGHYALITNTSEVVHDSGSGEPLAPHRVVYRVMGQMQDAHKHFGSGGALLAGASIWVMAVQRWLGGRLCQAVSRSLQPGRLAAAWGPIVFHPARWWNGYSNASERGRRTSAAPYEL